MAICKMAVDCWKVAWWGKKMWINGLICSSLIKHLYLWTTNVLKNPISAYFYQCCLLSPRLFVSKTWNTTGLLTRKQKLIPYWVKCNVKCNWDYFQPSSSMYLLVSEPGLGALHDGREGTVPDLGHHLPVVLTHRNLVMVTWRHEMEQLPSTGYMYITSKHFVKYVQYLPI